jgi:hypothetical protein
VDGQAPCACHHLRMNWSNLNPVQDLADIPFRVSRWLSFVSLALAAADWAYLVVIYAAAPTSWWAEQPFWVIPFITACYLLPVALLWTIWNRTGAWVRLVVAVIAPVYLALCCVTLFIVLGFLFLPAASFLLAACVFRLLAPLPTPRPARPTP